MNKLPSFLTVAVFAGSLCLAAQSDDLAPLNWDKLASHAKERVEVNLEGPMLAMASHFFPDGDSDSAALKRIVGKLKGVHIHCFEFAERDQYSAAELNDLYAQLRAPEWQQIVTSKSPSSGEDTRIYLKTRDGAIQGVVIVSAEPRELNVVSVVGSISPEDVGSLRGLGSNKHHSHHDKDGDEE